MLKIQNSSATFKLLPNGETFSSEQFLNIARNAICTVYEPRRFHAIIMRLRLTTKLGKKKTLAALVFQSAKVVLTGVPHPRMVSKMAEKVVRHLRCPKLGIHGLMVTNVVGSYQHSQRIAIEKMYAEMRERFGRHSAQYDPTIFPALRIKLDGTSALVYISGRTIVTGIRQTNQLFHFFSNILLPLLNEFPR